MGEGFGGNIHYFSTISRQPSIIRIQNRKKWKKGDGKNSKLKFYIVMRWSIVTVVIFCLTVTKIQYYDSLQEFRSLEQLEQPAILNEYESYKKNDSGLRLKEFINSLTLTQDTLKGGALRELRTYSKRISRGLSNERLSLMYNVLPKYLYSKQKLENETRESVLEIGFGTGEHLIHQAKTRPDVLFFGVEVYLNGVATTLRLAVDESVTNILLYPNNVDFILKDIPNSTLSQIYILFPDPWPKKKHHKKRLVNKDRFQILQTKLKERGAFIFSTDVEVYFDTVVQLIEENGNFEITNRDDYLQEPDNYVETTYHRKVSEQGKPVKFLICKKIK